MELRRQLAEFAGAAVVESGAAAGVAGSTAVADAAGRRWRDRGVSMAFDEYLTEFGGLPVVALLAGRSLTHLRTLNLRHHFISAGCANRLRAAWPGVDIDLSLARSDSPRPRAIAVAE